MAVDRPAWLLLFYVAVTAGLLEISPSLSPSALEGMMSLASNQD
jgi:hypothetical protein